jgi:hypothetical protein
MNTKCVFGFRVQLLSETFLILRRIQSDVTTYLNRHMQRIRYSCEISMELEYPWLSFEKSSNNKLHENPSSGSRVIPFGRTDTTKLTVVFRNFVKAPKILQGAHIAFLVRISEQQLLLYIPITDWLVHKFQAFIINCYAYPHPGS